MKKNSISEGFRVDKILKESLYNFIVDKQIDWAIIFGCVLCVFPYISSSDIYFLFVKLFIVFLIIFISYSYLKTWNEFNKYDKAKTRLHNILKPYIESEDCTPKSFKKTGEKLLMGLKVAVTGYEKNVEKYSDFNDYVMNNKYKLNSKKYTVDRKQFMIFFAWISYFIVYFMEKGEVPKRRLNNYIVPLLL